MFLCLFFCNGMRMYWWTEKQNDDDDDGKWFRRLTSKCDVTNNFGNIQYSRIQWWEKINISWDKIEKEGEGSFSIGRAWINLEILFSHDDNDKIAIVIPS